MSVLGLSPHCLFFFNIIIIILQHHQTFVLVLVFPAGALGHWKHNEAQQ